MKMKTRRPTEFHVEKPGNMVNVSDSNEGRQAVNGGGSSSSSSSREPMFMAIRSAGRCKAALKTLLMLLDNLGTREGRDCESPPFAIRVFVASAEFPQYAAAFGLFSCFLCMGQVGAGPQVDAASEYAKKLYPNTKIYMVISDDNLRYCKLADGQSMSESWLRWAFQDAEAWAHWGGGGSSAGGFQVFRF